MYIISYQFVIFLTFLNKNLLKMSERIILFGDSHTSVFTLKNGGMTPENILVKGNKFYNFRTWPYLCYNLKDKIPILKKLLESIKISKNDLLFISYGESDIRHHIGFRSNDNLEETTRVVVLNYIEVLKILKLDYSNLGVYAPIASGHGNQPGGNQRIPCYKNSYERNKITLIFNKILREECEKNDIIFKSIYKKLINENNETIKSIHYDGIHLNPRKIYHLLEEEFNLK